MFIEITDASFESEVLKAEGLVVVDFFAPWCGPCMQLLPIVDALSQEMSNVKFVKMNVDEHQDVAGQLGIMGIPALKFFKNGEMVGELSGYMPKEQLESEIQKYV